MLRNSREPSREFQSKCSPQPCKSRQRLRPGLPLLRQSFRSAVRFEEVTRLYHHWNNPYGRTDAATREAHLCQGKILQGVRWDSNPILADLPEVAMKCATGRVFPLQGMSEDSSVARVTDEGNVFCATEGKANCVRFLLRREGRYGLNPAEEQSPAIAREIFHLRQPTHRVV